MAHSKLRQELKKRRDFDSPEQEATLNLLRTNDQVQIRLARLFREFGLTPAQYNILRILRGAGEPLPILEIASRTVTVVPGITGLIDRLESAGHVCRKRCAEDRRVVRVSITEQALAALVRLDEPLLALQRTLMGHLSRSELRELSRLLEKVREPLATEG